MPRREASEGPSAADTWVLDCQPQHCENYLLQQPSLRDLVVQPKLPNAGRARPLSETCQDGRGRGQSGRRGIPSGISEALLFFH